ncbi:unnamed protein product [Protopolystoma xenopodis]|uniref:Uncharacterized protein n=1 Tax=Protopolystoma xenopodis TaxID=117903 RepID=A0A448XSN4_9PLAT|nr:unnamed protein product [Protopolystoma xenopodis]
MEDHCFWCLACNAQCVGTVAVATGFGQYPLLTSVKRPTSTVFNLVAAIECRRPSLSERIQQILALFPFLTDDSALPAEHTVSSC